MVKIPQPTLGARIAIPHCNPLAHLVPNYQVYQFHQGVSLEEAIEAVNNTDWQELIVQIKGHYYAFAAPVLWPFYSSTTPPSQGTRFEGCGYSGTFQYWDSEFNWLSWVDQSEWEALAHNGEPLGFFSSFSFGMAELTHGSDLFNGPDLSDLGKVANRVGSEIVYGSVGGDFTIIW